MMRFGKLLAEGHPEDLLKRQDTFQRPSLRFTTTVLAEFFIGKVAVKNQDSRVVESQPRIWAEIGSKVRPKSGNYGYSEDVNAVIQIGKVYLVANWYGFQAPFKIHTILTRSDGKPERIVKFSVVI